MIDRVEHRHCARAARDVFPSSLGGLNYSPAAYDPKTNYVFNAAAETAAVLSRQKLTPDAEEAQVLFGDVYLGLDNGNFGKRSQTGTTTVDQRDRVSTGKRVWKFQTPEPERGGVTMTASGLGFAGGGDGLLRAFELKTGKVLWTFHTGRRSQEGRRSSPNGKEYVAVTVGGTPTSSGGGVLSQLQVFSLGGLQDAGRTPSAAPVSHPVTTIGTSREAVRAKPAAAVATQPRIVFEGGAGPARALAGRELERGDGQRTLLLGGKPGRSTVGRRSLHLTQSTNADGEFVAVTRPCRSATRCESRMSPARGSEAVQ